MTKEQLIKRLKELSEGGDVEINHGEADDLLLEFIGDKEISDAYNEIEKWYA